MRVANSGLPYPLHYRAARKKAEPLSTSGLPLGTFDGATYDETSVELGPGDAFVFYSDGVTEALRGHEEYGVQRLLKSLERHGNLPAGELGERLTADLERFAGSAARGDDLTLVVVKVL